MYCVNANRGGLGTRISAPKTYNSNVFLGHSMHPDPWLLSSQLDTFFYFFLQAISSQN